MSIKLRLALLLGLLLLGFVGTLFWVRHLERLEWLERVQTDRQARTRLLNHWIELTGRALPQFAAETAQSNEFMSLVDSTDRESARRKIESGLSSAGVHGLWVLGEDGSARLHVGAGSDKAERFPLETPDFRTLVAETPSPRFFAEVGRELHEIAVRRLTPERHEWLAVARRWDQAQLQSLGQLTESLVSIADSAQLAQPPAEADRMVLVRALTDWRGRTLRVLRVEHSLAEIDTSLQADWRQVQVFLVFGLLILAALALAVQTWVVRPLGLIGRSLAGNTPQPALALAHDRGELGQVARLVVESFAQRDALQREIIERTAAQSALERSQAELRENIEERARLGRDLHDGVIQSLYAAGMGLAGVRMQLQPEQSEAAVRLEQTRAALNETIHDVRNFIIGLEPEALKLQTFAQAVGALLETMQNLRSFRSSIAIDEKIAARLTLAQRVHALQITREAVSNALRHGAAGHVQVRLGPQGEFAEFEVRDDGRGFVTASQPQGHGLANFAERARELGADLAVESSPGKGTRVRLTFSLPST